MKNYSASRFLAFYMLLPPNVKLLFITR